MIDLKAVGEHQWNVRVRDLIPLLYVSRPNVYALQRPPLIKIAVFADSADHLRCYSYRDQSRDRYPVSAHPNSRWPPNYCILDLPLPAMVARIFLLHFHIRRHLHV